MWSVSPPYGILPYTIPWVGGKFSVAIALFAVTLLSQSGTHHWLHVVLIAGLYASINNKYTIIS